MSRTDDAVLVRQTEEHVQTVLDGDSTGHDWWHVYRVWQTARRLCDGEAADHLVVELAALLHDIADWKFHNGDEAIGPRVARAWLESIGVASETTDHVCSIIQHLSFKGASVPTPMHSLEGKIVQDADRLDAIGAIGIARAFAFGGARGRSIHDPGISPTNHRTAEEYIAATGSTINHFYEKLLLLPERMNTVAGIALARERQAFMEVFLRQFFHEWDGEV